MRQNAMILLFALLIAAFLTLIYFFVKRDNTEWVKVLMVTQPVAQGEKILSNSLTWVKRPQKSIHPSMITTEELADRVIGSLAKNKLQVGQPLLIQNVRFIGGGIAARILDEGMFAVTLSMPKQSAIAKLITRGDRINIILTRGDRTQLYTRVVLEKVFVMMVAPQYQKPSEKTEGKPVLPNTMVLAMTAEQVKKLILAAKLGNISYALVSAHVDGKKAVNQDFILGNRDNPKMQVAKDLNEVQVIRGLKKQTKVLP